jgi:predicted dehydrogenase
MSSNQPIRIGIVGCGEIAQLMHLPFLDESPAFEVVALCDLSLGTAKALAERYRVPKYYTRSDDLMADPAVDAVIVCSFDHADVALSAIKAGKHVLVEKPLAFTPEEGRRVQHAADESGLVAMVGYMKLFDPGFLLGLEAAASNGPARRRQVHNLAGRFDSYKSLYDQIRVNDIPAGVLDASRAEVTQRIADHLGDREGWAELYTMLLMLGAHDLAVIRVAFGTPTKVAYASSSGQDNLTAVLEYPDGVPLLFEIGVGTRYDWWDEWLTVDTDTAQVRVEFSHPYIRYAPTTVRLRDSRFGVDTRSVHTPTADDPFRIELAHFADAIQNRSPVKSTIEGGLRDLELATDLIMALPPLAADGIKEAATAA